MWQQGRRERLATRRAAARAHGGGGHGRARPPPQFLDTGIAAAATPLASRRHWLTPEGPPGPAPGGPVLCSMSEARGQKLHHFRVRAPAARMAIPLAAARRLADSQISTLSLASLHLFAATAKSKTSGIPAQRALELSHRFMAEQVLLATPRCACRDRMSRAACAAHYRHRGCTWPVILAAEFLCIFCKIPVRAARMVVALDKAELKGDGELQSGADRLQKTYSRLASCGEAERSCPNAFEKWLK